MNSQISTRCVHVVKTNNPGGAGIVQTWINEHLLETYSEVITYVPELVDGNISQSSLNDLKSYINEAPTDIHIESDILWYYKYYRDFANNLNTKVYLRLHDPILLLGSDFRLNKTISFGNYEFKSMVDLLTMVEAPNLNFIVGNELDAYILRMFVPELRVEFSPFTGIKTPAMSATPVSKNVDKSHNILYVSAYYSKSKGILPLLSAINSSNLHEFEWYLVGDILNGVEYEMDMKGCPQAFECLKRSDIHIIGKVPNNELGKYYELCDTLLFPSYCESYGITAYEALSYGDKVVYLDLYQLPWMDSELAIPVHVDKVYNLNPSELGKPIIEVLRGNITYNKVNRSYSEIALRYLLTQFSRENNLYKED